MKYVTSSTNDFVSIEDNTTNIENDLHLNDTPTPTVTLNSTTKIDNKNFKDFSIEFSYKWPKTIPS